MNATLTEYRVEQTANRCGAQFAVVRGEGNDIEVAGRLFSEDAAQTLCDSLNRGPVPFGDEPRWKGER